MLSNDSLYRVISFHSLGDLWSVLRRFRKINEKITALISIKIELSVSCMHNIVYTAHATFVLK